jgi:hypothetical protein
MSETRPCDLCRTPTSPDLLVEIGGKTVCAKCKPEMVLNLKSGVSGEGRISPEKAEAIRKKISQLNLLSFALALPGIAIQVGATAFVRAQGPSPTGSILLLRLIGAPLIIIGLGCYARMKGRSWALGLLGLLSCLGLLLLAFWPKLCHNCKTSASYRIRECGSCGAPV